MQVNKSEILKTIFQTNFVGIRPNDDRKIVCYAKEPVKEFEICHGLGKTNQQLHCIDDSFWYERPAYLTGA